MSEMARHSWILLLGRRPILLLRLKMGIYLEACTCKVQIEI